ncbi:MAG: GNAT family N-acetyltransferase [Thermoleophilia bacterium]
MPELRHPDPPLADEGVLLRPWRRADAPAMVAAYADPLVHGFSWPYERGYTARDAHAFLDRQESARLRGEGIDFALADPDAPEVLLGGASMYALRPGGRGAAVGYWLAPGARGRGVATRAVRLIAGWAFDGLGLARLELTCVTDNLASQRVAERCGFTREALLAAHTPFKGTMRDTVLYGLRAGRAASGDGGDPELAVDAR